MEKLKNLPSGQCKACGQIVHTEWLGQFKTCACGKSSIDAGDGYTFRLIGEMEEWIEPEHQHGWRGTPENPDGHWEYGCSDGKHPSYWKTVVTSPQFDLWRKEQNYRFSEYCHLPDEAAKRAYDKGIFDVDESACCDWISPEHFQSFLEFCKTL